MTWFKLLLGSGAIALGLVGCVALPANVPRFPIDVPLADARTMLDTLCAQSQLQHLYPYEALNDVKLHPVHGVYSREEALTRALEGTGLSFEIINERTVTIMPQAMSPGATVPPP